MMAFCQVPGDVLRMRSKDFRRELDNGTALRSMVQRYAQGLMNQISLSTACNNVHSTEQRMARWLLMTHDRVGEDEFPLTQEFLAQMLGVRRASVTVCAGILQKLGAIEYLRGRLRVLNRRKLEEAACECYEIVRREYDRLLVFDSSERSIA